MVSALALLLAPDSPAGGPRLHALHADALALHLECDGDLLRVLEPGHVPASHNIITT